jgi:hypothetical protein
MSTKCFPHSASREELQDLELDPSKRSHRAQVFKEVRDGVERSEDGHGVREYHFQEDGLLMKSAFGWIYNGNLKTVFFFLFLFLFAVLEVELRVSHL